jgi:FKBP-type peptidyl-prolyl cis-trans isomerase
MSQQAGAVKGERSPEGLSQALQLMPVGSRWEIVIPPEFAYGENGALPIGPNATLNYNVEVLAIQ